MCMERRRFSETMASEWKLLLLSLTKCHGVPCSLPSRITTKVLKNCKTFSSRPRPRFQDQMFKTRTSWSKTKTKTFIFVIEAPRDQDPGLEVYITGCHINQAVGCHYFPPGPPLPPNSDSGAAGIRTRDLLIASPSL